jgi:hypothetical protein
MRFRTGRSVAVAVLAVAALVAGCTTNPPPGGRSWHLTAREVASVQSAGDWPITFWDPDTAEEPYLVHLSLRIKLGEPLEITTGASSIYSNGGQTICKLSQGQTCAGVPGDGPRFNGLNAPDLLDLSMGADLEIVGTVDFLFERDALIPVGIVGLLQGVTQIINAALPTILGSGGIPSDPQGIIDLLSSVLPGVLTTVVGAVGTILGNLAGGDEMIGIAPILFIAVGGTLAGILRNVLPSILDLVEVALAQQPDNPFPNGLPITLGIVGDQPRVRYGSATESPFKVFDVKYGWTVS